MSAYKSIEERNAYERDVERLKNLGVAGYIAEVAVDHVDIFKVEALVLARSCPVELALQIARQ